MSLSIPMSQLVNRFLHIFESHDITRAQIPAVLPGRFGVKVSDFRSEESILALLDDAELRSWVCEAFGIRPAWLEGDSDRIYKPVGYYKKLNTFVEDLAEWHRKHGHGLSLYVLRGQKTRPFDGSYRDPVFVVQLPLCSLGEKEIYRYLLITGPYTWDHLPARYEAKTIIRLWEEIGLPATGVTVSHAEKEAIAEGRTFPELHKASPGWWPSDYVYRPEEYAEAKETDEIEAVLATAQPYLDRLNALLRETPPTEEPAGPGSAHAGTVKQPAPDAALRLPASPVGLPGPLLRRLRQVLVTHDRFASDQALRTLFVDESVALWRDNLPEASSPDERVDALISYLLPRYNNVGDSGLVCFLRVLRDRIPGEDSRAAVLDGLLAELEGYQPTDSDEQRSKQ